MSEVSARERRRAPVDRGGRVRRSLRSHRRPAPRRHGRRRVRRATTGHRHDAERRWGWRTAGRPQDRPHLAGRAADVRRRPPGLRRALRRHGRSATASPFRVGRLMQPRVEAEVAFVLRSDLPDRPVIASDVMRATDFVVAAIEIVDSRIKDWNISIVDTVADNASSGMFVLGGVAEAPGRHRRPAGVRDGDDRRWRRRREFGRRRGVPRLADQRRRVARQRRRRTRRAAAGRRGDPVRLARPPRHRRTWHAPTKPPSPASAPSAPPSSRSPSRSPRGQPMR